MGIRLIEEPFGEDNTFIYDSRLGIDDLHPATSDTHSGAPFSLGGMEIPHSPIRVIILRTLAAHPALPSP